MPDWKWLIALAVAAILARVVQMGKELDALKKQFSAVRADDREPFPSDGSDEAKAIQVAKALHKSAGEKFTWEQAKKVAKKIVGARRAKETTGGSDDKQTA